MVNCVGVLQVGLRDDVQRVRLDDAKALFDGCDPFRLRRGQECASCRDHKSRMRVVLALLAVEVDAAVFVTAAVLGAETLVRDPRLAARAFCS